MSSQWISDWHSLHTRFQNWQPMLDILGYLRSTELKTPWQVARIWFHVGSLHLRCQKLEPSDSTSRSLSPKQRTLAFLEEQAASNSGWLSSKPHPDPTLQTALTLLQEWCKTHNLLSIEAEIQTLCDAVLSQYPIAVALAQDWQVAMKQIEKPERFWPDSDWNLEPSADWQHWEEQFFPRQKWPEEAQIRMAWAWQWLTWLSEHLSDEHLWQRCLAMTQRCLQAATIDVTIRIGPSREIPTTPGYHCYRFPIILRPSDQIELLLSGEQHHTTIIQPQPDHDWPTEAQQFRRLPKVPDWPELYAHVLRQLQESMQNSSYTIDDWPKDREQCRLEFQNWLTTPTGLDWFDHLLKDAAQHPSTAASTWWHYLRSEKWCHSYPDWDDDGQYRWPSNTPLTWPILASRPSDQPWDQIIVVERFSPTPRLARIIVSDGPVEADSPLAKFHQLISVLQQSEAWSEGRWELARTLSSDKPSSFDEILPLVSHWQTLIQVAPKQLRQKQMQAMSEWLSAFGIESVSDTVQESPALEIHYEFSPEPAETIIGQTGLALTQGETVLSRSVREVSVGPAPEGYADLLALIETWPTRYPITDQIRAFPRAAHGDYLREAALGVFTEYWSDAGMELRQDTSRAEPFEVTLTKFLQRAFELDPFYPTSLHDYPDGWTSMTVSSRAVSGIVRCIVRPGLQNAAGELIIPALIEVD